MAELDSQTTSDTSASESRSAEKKVGRASRRRAAGVPRVRAPKVGFTDVPRRWFADSTAVSHLVNSVNLLFPAGERFFVRAVRHYLDELTDEELAQRVRGFFGQEGRHAYAHERYFETMRAQGYDVDGFLAPYEKLAYDIVEKASPPALRLAVTVALEHYTAILAEEALTSGVLEGAHPAMRQLLQWHAVEELEHKSVAFDVLRAVAPGYPLRIAGFVLGSILLGGFWFWGMQRLMREDGKTMLDARAELASVRRRAVEDGRLRAPRSIVTGVFLRGLRDYLKPGFHPSDTDHGELVRTTLAKLSSEGVIDAQSAVDAA